MKITKSRLVDLIKEEAEKLAAPEEGIVEEGIFDFFTSAEPDPSHGEKLNQAFRVLVTEDQRLKTMIQDSSREMKRLFARLEAKIDKLASPEEDTTSGPPDTEGTPPDTEGTPPTELTPTDPRAAAKLRKLGIPPGKK